jgi:hypothetical protein
LRAEDFCAAPIPSKGHEAGRMSMVEKLVEKKDSTPISHLAADKDPVWWDWWSENPTEIVLVIFILVFFFMMPRVGCGVTDTTPVEPAAPVEQGAP